MGLNSQEAIKILKANYPTPNYSELREAVDMALALLREQEPVEPKRVLGVLPDWYHCGACGMDMLDTGDGYRPKYCPQCGRAVKWDG